MADPDPATNHHETVLALRQQLMRQAGEHDRQAMKYGMEYYTMKLDDELTPEQQVLAAAVLGNTMASTYAYLLSGLLGVAQAQHGEECARMLAFELDEALTNGDFEELNAGVLPIDE